MTDLKNSRAPEELSVLDLFARDEYIIPIYQRNYAWSNSEIEQLLDDIIDSENVYYLGSLIVDKRANGVYEVIDGQQRLTTLFLLMVYLDRNNSLNRNSLRFEAREKSNRTLQEIKSNFISSEWYSDEIADGYNNIEKYFRKKAEENKIDSGNENDFSEKLKARLSDIKIIRTQVPDNIDLNHYFEIMNTRGEQLELHEIAKAKLLEVIKDEKDKEIASLIWNACAGMDKYVQMNFEKKYREIIFGKDWDNFCIDSLNDLKTKIQQHEEKIKKGINESSGEKISPKSATLSEILKNELKPNSKDNETNLEENERFESIISFPNFLLQVNAAMKNDKNEDDNSIDDKRLLELLEPHWSSRENAINFIFSLLKIRWLFDKFVIKREFAKNYKEDGKWSLQQLKVNMNNGAYFVSTYGGEEADESNVNRQIKMLQACLRITYTAPKSMHWLSRILANLQKNDKANQIEFLEAYARSKIQESDYESYNGFNVKRIVFTYLDYILWRDNMKKFKDFQFQFRNSIEHFYPQNPADKKYIWKEIERDDFGNLALITVSANSKFSNLLPASKIDTYKDVIQQSPKLIIMSELIGNDGWTYEKVKEHGKKMKEILRSGKGALSEN